MSVFVDNNRLIDIFIKVKFVKKINDDEKEEIDFVKVVKNSEDSVLKENEYLEDINCKAKQRDFDTMSRVLEESTIINHINAQPMIRMWVFRKLIMLYFFKEWNIKDINGKVAEINSDNISKMHYVIVKELTDIWTEKTSNA